MWGSSLPRTAGSAASPTPALPTSPPSRSRKVWARRTRCSGSGPRLAQLLRRWEARWFRGPDRLVSDLRVAGPFDAVGGAAGSPAGRGHLQLSYPPHLLARRYLTPLPPPPLRSFVATPSVELGRCLREWGTALLSPTFCRSQGGPCMRPAIRLVTSVREWDCFEDKSTD